MKGREASISLLNSNKLGEISWENCPIKSGNHSLPPGNALRLGFRKNNYQPAPKQEPAIGGREWRWYLGRRHCNRVHNLQGGIAMNAQRPLPVTGAAILLVLLSLFDFPFSWRFLFPGVEEPPAFVIYSGIVVGIVGLGVAVGLWIMKPWSYWATIVVCVLNLNSGAPGVVLGPTAGIQVTNAVLEVVAVLTIVLVVLPTSRRAFAAA